MNFVVILTTTTIFKSLIKNLVGQQNSILKPKTYNVEIFKFGMETIQNI